MNETTGDIQTELIALRHEISHLNSHRFVRLHNSIPKLIIFNLIRGLAFGLGTVLGATILVWILGQFLSNIDFIPIIGEWAAEIANQMAVEK
ncbi:MAG: DUF5665 domain-containing protein [Paracoccaceae bacterium]